MPSSESSPAPSSGELRAGTVDMNLEAVTIPVSDVDRAKAFYQNLGWRLDADIVRGEHSRVVQLTPTHSGCSVALIEASRLMYSPIAQFNGHMDLVAVPGRLTGSVFVLHPVMSSLS